MAPSGVLLALLQLCSLQLLLVSMPTKCPLAGHLVMNTHHRLREMGAPIPVDCLSHNWNMSFPDTVLPAAPANHSQVSWVVYESLREAEIVFMEHYLPGGVDGVKWDEDKLEKFLNLQNRVVEEGHCLSSVNTSGVLSSYFRNVTAVIETQDACGWEVLRKDLLWVLKSILQRHHQCFKW